MPEKNFSENFADSALIVLGHGSEGSATSTTPAAAPAQQHAAALRRRGIFREVHAAFWKQEPQIKTMLAALTAPRIFIVPLFAGEGYFSTEIIPRELGFSFPDHLKLNTKNSKLFYCLPVGSHPRMTEVILARAENIVRQYPAPCAVTAAETTLFIAGHGTERHAGSRTAIERQADLIRALNRYAAVHAVFLDEAPRVPEIYALAQTRFCVVAPFFISDGLHVAEDIPVRLGEPEKSVRERRAAGQPPWRNPTEKHGKLVWYAPAIGAEPLLAEVILARVREAAYGH